MTRPINPKTRQTLLSIGDIAVVLSSVYLVGLSFWSGDFLALENNASLSITYSFIAFLVPIAVLATLTALGMLRSRSSLPAVSIVPMLTLALVGVAGFMTLFFMIYLEFQSGLMAALVLIIFFIQKLQRSLMRMLYIFYDLVGVFLSTAVTLVIAALASGYGELSSLAVFTLLFPTTTIIIEHLYVTPRNKMMANLAQNFGLTTSRK